MENVSGMIDVGKGSVPGQSFHLGEYFSPGRIVRCSVVKVWGKGDDADDGDRHSKGKKKNIDLSLRMEAVNAGLRRDAVFEGAQLVGCVKSVEDHGYLIDFGIKGATGFLPRKRTEGVLQKGCIVDVVVKSVGTTGGSTTAQLTALAADVRGAVTQAWTGVDIDSLIPGMLVNVNVRNVLSDGLLVSFLTFFTGTIDPFHLDRALAKCKAGQKVKARVLYCDPGRKQVSLSLLPHLVGWQSPDLPGRGEVYEQATVRRVDEGLGLAIDLPISGSAGMKESDADHTAKDAVYRSYAHISNISDTQKIDDLAKRFKQGQVVKCRVVGFRQLDGLANVSLKPTMVEGSLLDISELRAGVKVSGVVESIDSSAVTVRLSPHLKAVVPALHMSEATHKKAHKKFKVGQKVSGAVLEVQPEKRKILMTMKKSLIDSKYPIIGSLADVSAGMKSHGVVTGIRDDGIFVTFYNSMSGMIGESQLGLKSSQSPRDAFSVGQIVKARVLGSNIKTKKLRLTLLTKQQAADVAARNDKLGGLAVGELVRGIVKQVLKRNGHASSHDEMEQTGENSEDAEDGEEEVTGYIFQLDTLAKNVSTEAFGRLDVGHLADHPSACSALADILEVGAVIEDLVVLEKLETVQQVRLTNKDSIRRHIASGEMPMRLEDIRVGSVLPGFVASIAADAVYVRFLDHLTGRARLQQLSDSPVADPAVMFHLNMSVRACVSQVDLEKGQISISLKESVCSETDGMYVRSLFQDLELAGRLDSDTSVDWGTAFRPFGSKVDVTVHSIKEYGILCDFKKYPDVVGLVAEGQYSESQAEKLTEGSRVTTSILDVSRRDGIVDLSALDHVRTALKRKSKGVDEVTDGEVVETTVLQVKADDGYAIVALPESKKPPVGFACLADFNQRAISNCTVGVKLKARVVAMPSAATGDRLVLVPADASRAATRKANAKAAGGARKELPERGSQVDIKVDAVHSLHADVTLQEDGEAVAKGKLHISQITPWSPPSSKPSNVAAFASSMSSIIPGSLHKAFVIGLTDLKGKKAPTVHVSLQRPNDAPAVEWKTIEVGDTLNGYVQEVKKENIWITYSPFVKGRCFIPDCSATLEDCANASSAYPVGTPVSSKVVSVNHDKHAMDVVLLDGQPGDGTRSFAAGTLACGYVTGASGTGVAVKLAWDTVGRVNLTDVYSVAVKNALLPVETLKGTFVKVAVVSTKATKTNPSISLSLRPSAGAVSTLDEGKCETLPSALVPKPSIKLAELSPGTAVSGYVKVAGKMGVFITLGRDLEARIKLRQLQDEFVEDPLTSYPPGTFVQGRVVSINNGKIDVSLRTRKTNSNVDGYHEGQIIQGTVKRIEKFGVFISIADSTLTGMAHVSELCDGFVQDIDKLFSVGQEVQARVIKVDKENGKLSLGLKPSYFDLGDEDEGQTTRTADGQDSDDDLDQALLAARGNAMSSSDDSDDDTSDEDDPDGGSDEMDIDELLVS